MYRAHRGPPLRERSPCQIKERELTSRGSPVRAPCGFQGPPLSGGSQTIGLKAVSTSLPGSAVEGDASSSSCSRKCYVGLFTQTLTFQDSLPRGRHWRRGPALLPSLILWTPFQSLQREVCPHPPARLDEVVGDGKFFITAIF